MKFLQGTLFIGIVLLGLITGVCRGSAIGGPLPATASFGQVCPETGGEGGISFRDCLKPAARIGLGGGHALEPWSESSRTPFHYAEAGPWGMEGRPVQALVLMGDLTGKALQGESDPEVLLLFGAGFIALGFAVKGSEKKGLKEASPKKVRNLAVTPLTGLTLPAK